MVGGGWREKGNGRVHECYDVAGYAFVFLPYDVDCREAKNLLMGERFSRQVLPDTLTNTESSWYQEEKTSLAFSLVREFDK